MSEIPYFFETPIPKYFRESGWFNNPNTILFVTWAFSKCSTQPHCTVMDGKEITLAPYEFVAGRLTSPKECHLSEEAWRHQLNTQLKAGLLKKTPNSAPNRFTCYIWVTDRFCKPNPQLNPQPTPNSPPTEPPQSRREKKRSKKDLPSSLPSVDEGGLIDDSLSIEKIEVYQGIFLTPPELDECIQVRGSLEAVKNIVHQVMNCKGRKYEITDWVTTIKTWKMKNMAKSRIVESENYAKKLVKMFPDFKDGNGWRCYQYRDTMKDQIGILFEPESAYKKALFVDYADPEFLEKCRNALRENKMQKGRLD